MFELIFTLFRFIIFRYLHEIFILPINFANPTLITIISIIYLFFSSISSLNLTSPHLPLITITNTITNISVSPLMFFKNHFRIGPNHIIIHLIITFTNTIYFIILLLPTILILTLIILALFNTIDNLAYQMGPT